MSTFTPEDLRVALRHGIEQVSPPIPDLPEVRRRRTRARTRRATAGLLVAASLVAGTFVLARHTPELVDRPDRFGFAQHGPLDLSQGAQAYGVDGKVLHIGGNTYDWPSTIGLDTQAVATSWGLVFPDGRGRPQLLGRDGEVTLLDDSPADAVRDFHPSIQWSPATGQIAYALTYDGTVSLHLRSLDDGTAESIDLACTGSCEDVQVDAVDSERVFVSTSDGTAMWRADQDGDQLVSFAGKGTRVVDARNKVLLYAGNEEPSPLEGWRYVQGRADDELTFDGSHVLGWSSVLRSTDGSAPIVLEQGARSLKGGPVSFFTLDTDGSVLVARAVEYPEFEVYDCAVPSGTCQFLRREKSGDPVFIGNDS